MTRLLQESACRRIGADKIGAKVKILGLRRQALIGANVGADFADVGAKFGGIFFTKNTVLWCKNLKK